MKRFLFVIAAVFVLPFAVSCEKGPSAEDLSSPEFGKMSAVPDFYSARLSCAISHSRGVVSCGLYLAMEGEKETVDHPAVVDGDSLRSEVTSLYMNTKYYYRFFVSNGEVVMTSPVDSFTTLYNGPRLKCDYIDEWGINHGDGIVFGNTVWAPVNCGYHCTKFPLGKFYQWGRKYGVGGKGYDVDEVTISPMWTGNNGEEDKNSLYCSGQGSAFKDDWILKGDAKFWNSGTDEAPVKTEFDPCPQGWRVPTGAELDTLRSREMIPDISSKVHGYWFQNENDYMYLTAGGGYLGTGMNYDARGEKAFYWSSKHQHSLYFHISYITMQECTLVDAQNVRCVQE